MDTTRALQLARLSGLVYEDWDVVKTGLNVLGFTMVTEPWDHAGTQGMLVENKLYATIVFRGTEASKFKSSDVFSNIGHPTSWAGKGLVHSGYLRHFNKVRYDARRLAEHVSSSKPLYTTGHSMGGVLASLYASWADHKLAGLVSFGAPKSMNEEAAKQVKCPDYRHINKYDPFPHWPISVIFVHLAEAITLNSGGWPGPVSRHMVSRYIEALGGKQSTS